MNKPKQFALPDALWLSHDIQKYMKDKFTGGYITHPNRTAQTDRILLELSDNMSIISKQRTIADFLIAPQGRYALNEIGTRTDDKGISAILKNHLIQFIYTTQPIIDVKRD